MTDAAFIAALDQSQQLVFDQLLAKAAQFDHLDTHGAAAAMMFALIEDPLMTPLGLAAGTAALAVRMHRQGAGDG